jgi:DNA recombination protein RmuC
MQDHLSLIALLMCFGSFVLFGVMVFQNRGAEVRLRQDLRDNREELSSHVSLGQSAMQQQVQQLMQEVNVNLHQTEQKWFEVQGIGTSVHQLLAVFKSPSERGRLLGEVTLERLLKDTLPISYYSFQFSIGSGRVDAAVHFPNAHVSIPIDSKFSKTGNPGGVLRMGKEIAEKYIRPDLGTTPFAYMFLPTESLWEEVMSDSKLWNELRALKVYPLSPNTLAIVLLGWSHSISYFEKGTQIAAMLREFESKSAEIAVIAEEIEEASKSIRKASETLNRCRKRAEELAAHAVLR